MEERVYLVTSGEGVVVDKDVTVDGQVAAVVRIGDGFNLTFGDFTMPVSEEVQFPVLYLCYPDFLLKQLDLKTHRVKERTIPAAVRGSSAITCLGSTVFFHSTYEDRTGIYRWKLE